MKDAPVPFRGRQEAEEPGPEAKPQPRERVELKANESKQEEKRRKKETKLARDSQRPLESWERYRALVDALDEAHDLVELADRKARFALVVMGALNVVLFLLATRTELVELIPEAIRSWIGVYLVVYAAVAVYFFLQAIEALRPRRFNPNLRYPGEAGHEHFPLGVRYYEDVVLRDVEAYRRAWREIRVGQLNAELAVQAHTMGRINQDKYRALRRLYAGLRVMTLMSAGLVSVLGFSVFLARPGKLTLPLLGSGPSSPDALRILGAPAPIALRGIREPSGVAYHPRLGRIFVAGDEGRLAELDPTGSELGRFKVKGNLEDVAVHTPSGDLLLLAELRSELIRYDPVAHEERRRWRLDRAALLGQRPAEKNQGFEGLAFREEPLRPGGGVLYLAHQRAPAMIVTIAFDPERPSGELGAETVIDRWRVKGNRDLTAVTYVPSLDRLLVIADAKNHLVVLRMDGSREAEIALPGQQQEGLCLDDEGSLWVADDRGGLMRFDGALSNLEAALRAKAAPRDSP